MYVWIKDYTHVKFYERSLMDECMLEGARFEGFDHAAWDPANPDAGPYARRFDQQIGWWCGCG
jgi:hypothetical protein